MGARIVIGADVALTFTSYRLEDRPPARASERQPGRKRDLSPAGNHGVSVLS